MFTQNQKTFSMNRIAGGSPAADYFLLCGQKKVIKENATLICHTYVYPARSCQIGRCATRTIGYAATCFGRCSLVSQFVCDRLVADKGTRKEMWSGRCPQE
jgi:hypothetical protein